MFAPLDVHERETIALEVGSIRSIVLLMAWTIDMFKEGESPQESLKQFELHEGASFVLDSLAERLSDVYDQMHVD